MDTGPTSEIWIYLSRLSHRQARFMTTGWGFCTAPVTETSRWRTQGLGREGLSGSGLCSTVSCSVLALPWCCSSGPIDGLSLRQENVQEVLRQLLVLLGSLRVMSGDDRSFTLIMA